MITPAIIANRNSFLSELRSGKHSKGTIKTDERGFPIFENDKDKNGACCCGVMAMMFGQTDSERLSLPKAMKALGLDSKDCKFIQTKINDTETTLKKNAERIEVEVFGSKHYR